MQLPNHTAVYSALLSAKRAFGPVLKDKTNPAFKTKYANLEAVLDAVDPSLLANDLLLTQATEYQDGWSHMILRTTITHVEGGQIESTYRIKPVKDDPQGEGGAITYARRYSILALLGIAPEDDDGKAASSRPVVPPRDWMAEVAKAKTADGARATYRLCNSKGEMTPEIVEAIRLKVLELEPPATHDDQGNQVTQPDPGAPDDNGSMAGSYE